MNCRILIFCSFLCAALLLAGCSLSSPRYGSHQRKTDAASAPAKKQTPRFATKEAEEERNEDDKKIEPKEIEHIVGGKRDYTREKNAALKPLDQSRMMQEISRYMGVSYLLGGASADGMDCSGYTMTVYKNAIGKQLPRTSAEQAKLGETVNFKDLKFGDLVFFNTTGESASHVGIYLGDDLFAHASVSLGVTISSLQSAYYQKRYETAKRIVE